MIYGRNWNNRITAFCRSYGNIVLNFSKGLQFTDYSHEIQNNHVTTFHCVYSKVVIRFYSRFDLHYFLCLCFSANLQDLVSSCDFCLIVICSMSTHEVIRDQ